jgi:predicted DNA-binding transcriptional regulator AlpA
MSLELNSQTATDRPLHERPAQPSTSASRTASSDSASAGLTRLLDERQAADRLGVSVALMRKMRRQGTGPAFARIGRLIRYPENSVARYVDARRVEPKQ